MDQTRNDEINLLLVLKTLWDGKWKIFSFILIFFAIIVVYIFYTPKLFEVTTNVQKSSQNLYYKYKYLNDILIVETDVVSNDINFKVFQVDDALVFDMFIREFKDYEEMIDVLSKNDFVKDKIKNLNDVEKRKVLISFAKKFNISKSNRKNDTWKISFLWHEIREGASLFNSALDLTLINVQKSLSREINNIAKSIDLENQRKIISLKNKLQTMREANKLYNAKKTIFLSEQSNIAKELGIENNEIIANNLNISSIGLKKDAERHETESQNFPYFLRGYKAIDKEIDLIKNRTDLDNDLLMKGFINLKEKLIFMQNDIRSKALKDAIKIINSEDVTKWVDFNLELAEVKSLKKSILYIFLSITIGAILGIFYVLINSNLSQMKSQK